MKTSRRRFSRAEKSLWLAPLLLALLGGWLWWRQRNDTKILVQTAELNYVRHVRFSPDGRRLLVVFNHKNLHIAPGDELNPLVNQIDDTAIYDVGNRSKICDLQAPASIGEIEWPVWSPDGTRIAAGGAGAIGLWNARNGQFQKSWPYHFKTDFAFNAPRVAFSRDGQSVIGQENPRAVFDVQSGKQVRRVVGSFESNGLSATRALSATQIGNTIEVCDARSHLIVWTRDLSHAECVFGWSPDGKYLAVLEGDGDAGEDGYFLQWRTLTIFDAGKRTVWQQSWKSLDGSPCCFDWSPDSKQLAIGLSDGVELMPVEG